MIYCSGLIKGPHCAPDSEFTYDNWCCNQTFHCLYDNSNICSCVGHSPCRIELFWISPRIGSEWCFCSFSVCIYVCDTQGCYHCTHPTPFLLFLLLMACDAACNSAHFCVFVSLTEIHVPGGVNDSPRVCVWCAEQQAQPEFSVREEEEALPKHPGGTGGSI